MFNFDDAMQRLHDERKQVLNSKIVARATITQEGKQGVLIIAAFELSTRYAFWYIFHAKTARSPRRTWEFKSKVAVWAGKVMELDDMIKSRVLNMDSAKITKRYPQGKRLFASLLDREANPQIIQQTPTVTTSFDMQNKRLARKMKGRTLVGWG